MTAAKSGQVEYNALTEALHRTTPPCADDGRYTAERDAINGDALEQMNQTCRRCPVLDLCLAYAEAGRPKGGYWAGRYWGRVERSEA